MDVSFRINKRFHAHADHTRKGLAFFGTPHSQESELRNGSHKGLFERRFCSDARSKSAPGLQIPPTLSSDFRHHLEDFLYISFYCNNDEVRDSSINDTLVPRMRYIVFERERLNSSLLDRAFQICGTEFAW
jgi:hypothetical protein